MLLVVAGLWMGVLEWFTASLVGSYPLVGQQQQLSKPPRSLTALEGGEGADAGI